MPDTTPDLAAAKQDLRARLRFRRRHFTANLDPMARLAAFRALPAPLADLLTRAETVAAYVAYADEPDILRMFAEWPHLALPFHSARSAPMEFRRWAAGAPLAEGPWGVQQPVDGSSVHPDLIFCPLVGFDRRGARLGQGGGHYDRYFAANPAPFRIGVGWSVQEVDAVPTESTDAPLDAVLTEQEFIMCGERL